MDAKLTVQDSGLIERLDQMPKQLHDALLQRMEVLTARMETRIRESAPRHTGRLQGSVYSTVNDYDNGDKGARIRGWVSVSGDFAKAATLEYGSSKKITVNLSNAKARATQSKTKFSLRLARPWLKDREYFRTLNIQATHFIHGPGAAMEGEFEAAFRDAVEETIGD